MGKASMCPPREVGDSNDYTSGPTARHVAAAQAAGINMDNYDFDGFDPGGSEIPGASNQGVINSIVDSYMDNPSRTGMAIRQSVPFLAQGLVLTTR